MIIELSGREVAILSACLRRCQGWDDPRELHRFLTVAREVIGVGDFTDDEMDAVQTHLADAWRQSKAHG